MITGYHYKFYLNANHAIYLNGQLGQTHPHTWEFSFEVINENKDFVLFNKVSPLIDEMLNKYQNQNINNIDNDIIYETQIRRISREFDDYRNRYGEDVDTDDETASSAETDYVDENGIYNEKFRRRLIDKLNSNGIKYCEYETNEEIGCKIAELLDNDDSVVAKYNGMYRIIFVDKKQSECDSILVESYKKIKAGEVK